MNNKILILFIYSIINITINLWLLSLNNINLILQQPLRSISQILALLGIILMSITLFLATRSKILEVIIKDKSKVPFIHHILGMISFIFIMNHPILLIAQSLPNTTIAKMYLLPGLDLSYNLGIFGLYIMIVSFVCMVFIKLPYRLWKYSHKLLILAFILGSIHALIIPSGVSAFLPLKLWVGMFIIIGFVSSIYILFIYKQNKPKLLS